MNIPLIAGTGSAGFRALYEREIFPALDEYEPELLMISAGFDAHKKDPLAAIDIDQTDFGWLTTGLVSIADRHCDGKIVSVLEGGYNLEALRSSAEAHLRALL
jgi:acetoin utilization deacetylase AcuC-like enzyme